MENKINIAELLKDCPKGMELDCAIWDNVVFDHVDTNSNYPIYIKKMSGELECLTEDGCFNFNSGAKCVIYPKGKPTWEGFVPPCKFKTGDVLFVDCSDDEDKSYQYIFILNDPEFYGKWHSYCHLDGVGCFHSEETYLTDEAYHPRFATEEEKKKLFGAIKANGYKWNPETKTLEKLIEPKFKVGDKIIKRDSIVNSWIVSSVSSEYYGLKSPNGIEGIGVLPVSEQDEYELVPNKFDVINFEPFMKVLVRSDNSDVWECDFFSLYNPKCSNRFHCIGAWYNICIPYIGNEHLLGTTDDCDEFYKNW